MTQPSVPSCRHLSQLGTEHEPLYPHATAWACFRSGFPCWMAICRVGIGTCIDSGYAKRFPESFQYLSKSCRMKGMYCPLRWALGQHVAYFTTRCGAKKITPTGRVPSRSSILRSPRDFFLPHLYFPEVPNSSSYRQFRPANLRHRQVHHSRSVASRRCQSMKEVRLLTSAREIFYFSFGQANVCVRWKIVSRTSSCYYRWLHNLTRSWWDPLDSNVGMCIQEARAFATIIIKIALLVQHYRYTQYTLIPS